MGETREPERIEIELTSIGEARDRTRDRPAEAPDGASSAAAPPGSSEQPAKPRAAEQRQAYAVAAIVGVVGLLLGWLIGQSSGSSDSASPPTLTVETSTLPATTTTFLAGEAIPRVQPTTTVRPTTTLPAATSSAIELDPRLAGLDLTLVGRRDNTLVEIDLATLTVVERQLPPTGNDPYNLVVGDDWVLFGDPGGGRSTVVYDDGTSETVFLGNWWQPLWIPGTDRFWIGSDLPQPGGPVVFSEVDLTGEPTGPTIDVPTGAYPWMADPRGGLVVTVAGGTYSLGESSVGLIGAGDLLGLSNDTAVFRTCDEQLRCGLSVIDRRSGEQRTVDLDPTLYLESAFYYGGSRDTLVSPDGRYCTVMFTSGDSYQLGLTDLDTGAVTGLTGDVYGGPSGVVWSPDGRFAFFLGSAGIGSAGIQAFDVAAGEVFTVVETDSYWSALGKRPDTT